MRRTLRNGAILGGLVSGAALATLHEVPYTGGKIAGTVTVPVYPRASPFIDTVRIGNVVVRLAHVPGPLPTVCGAKPKSVVQFFAPFGIVSQTADSSADWNAITTWPASGLVPLDTVLADDGVNSWIQDVGVRAPGFPLYEAGQARDCMNSEYFMASHWKRIVLIRYGSGVDYRAKLSFQAVTDSSYAVTPMIQGAVLMSLRLHYVLNANSTDVHEPLISVAPRVRRSPNTYQGWQGMDFYDLRGVKSRREPRRFEMLLPVVR